MTDTDTDLGRIVRERVWVLVIVLGAGPGVGVSQHPLASIVWSSPALLDPNISLKYEI